MFVKKVNKEIEGILEKSISFCAFISIAIIILIISFILKEALPLFCGKAEDDNGIVGFSRLFDLSWIPVSNYPKYGIIPLFAASLKISFIALLIAFPVSVFSALFTATFAPKFIKEIMKPAIEILAGIPSVVIGFFALAFLASFLQKLFGYHYRLNAFSGGVALSLALIPIIYTVIEDALNSVPKSLKEASMALGATKWETSFFVVLPAATPGVFAAFLLGFGRAIGETMIVLMASGNAALLSFDIFEPVRTMSATIGAEMAEVVFGDAHYNILFFIGTCLLGISLIINAIAEFVIRRRIMRRFRGIT
jgi:phosphate transport system permease protein